MRTFAIASLLLILGNSIGLALAQAVETCESHGIRYDCITETIQRRTVPVYYSSNGQLIKGNASDAAALQTVFDSWPTRFDTVNVPLTAGARVGATAEMKVDVYHLNASGGPFAYTPSVNLTNVWESDARRSVTLDSLTPAARYALNASAADFMNGASSVFFRGVADIPTGAIHALEIRNRTGDVVLRTSTDFNDEAEVIAGRAYYRLSFPFYTGQAYTFTEYIRFADATAPVEKLQLWVSPFEMPALGSANFTAYPGDAIQTLVQFPPSYSFIFHIGLGEAGIEQVIRGDANFTAHDILTYARGRDGADPTHVMLTLPFRASEPIDVGIRATVDRSTSGAIVYDDPIGTFQWIHNVTDTLVFSLDGMTQLGSNGYNRYAVTIRFNLTPGQLVAYNTIPPSQDWNSNRAGVGIDVLQHGHRIVSLTSTSAAATRFYGWLPQLGVHAETNTTSPSPFPDFREFLSKGIAIALFALQFVPGINLVINTVGCFADAKPGDLVQLRNCNAMGACRALNRFAGGKLIDPDTFDALATPDDGIENETRNKLVCDEPLLQGLQDGANAAALGLACALSAGTAAFGYLTADIPLALLGGAVAGVVCPFAIESILKFFGIDLWEIIKQALETIGAWIDKVLTWLVPVLVGALILIGLFMALAVLFIIWKYLALFAFSLLAFIQGQRASELPQFRRYYNLYIPLWSDFVERRLFGMEVRP